MVVAMGDTEVEAMIMGMGVEEAGEEEEEETVGD